MSIHRQKTHLLWLVLGLLLSAPVAFAAPDYEREKRWHDEVAPNIVTGEPVYLTQKNRHKFLGIYTRADNARMGLVVVHGMGIHPDWGMVNTLREGLAEQGYSTLSIQMPVLAAEAKADEYPAIFPDAAERLQLAVAHLKGMGYQHIAIVSHSNGSRMARVYMVTNPSEVDAWAALSLTQGDTFAGVTAPILDLYGSDDLPHVLASVKQRKASLNRKTASRQVMISGANHFFAGQEALMVKSVKDFLDDVN